MTSREATEKQLRDLRWSTAKRFLLAIGIALGTASVLQAVYLSIFNDARIGSARYLGLLLTALSDLFLASSILLLNSVFTRPISQIIGSMLDLLQSTILVIVPAKDEQEELSKRSDQSQTRPETRGPHGIANRWSRVRCQAPAAAVPE